MFHSSEEARAVFFIKVPVQLFNEYKNIIERKKEREIHLKSNSSSGEHYIYYYLFSKENEKLAQPRK
jgi:hypothetical protein